MPQWWNTLMEWLDTSFVPVWVVCLAFIAYFLRSLWRDLRIYRNHNDPPPPYV
jgi:hypothetical protein